MGITYETIGSARITVTSDSDGVTVTANRDGFASLAKLFAELAHIDAEHEHIHLTPSLQLADGSLPLTVGIGYDSPSE